MRHVPSAKRFRIAYENGKANFILLLAKERGWYLERVSSHSWTDAFAGFFSFHGLHIALLVRAYSIKQPFLRRRSHTRLKA